MSAPEGEDFLATCGGDVVSVSEERVDDLDDRLGRIEALATETLDEVRHTNGRVSDLEVTLFGDHRPGRKTIGVAEQMRLNQPVVDQMRQLNRKLSWLLGTLAGGAATAMGAFGVQLLHH